MLLGSQTGCLFLSLLILEYSVEAMIQSNQCYRCGGEASPLDCTSIVSCNYISYCYTARGLVGGNIRYYAGCAPLSICPATRKRLFERPISSMFQEFACCGGDYCNGKSLLQHATTTASIATTAIHTQTCYQCYDVRLDSRGQQHPCYDFAICTSLASKCSTVYRREHNIVTVDLDCEENLKFSVGSSSVQQLCSVTCDGDRCNRNQDCRNAV